MNGLPYYRRRPRDFFEGTVGMPFEVKGAYSLVLDLIYMQGGKLADDPRFIAGHLGCSVRMWNKCRAALIGRGKLYVFDGIISNLSADKEVEETGRFLEKQRENGSKPKRTNGFRKPSVKPNYKPNGNHIKLKTIPPNPPKGGGDSSSQNGEGANGYRYDSRLSFGENLKAEVAWLAAQDAPAAGGIDADVA